jgi:hypothetical protein
VSKILQSRVLLAAVAAATWGCGGAPVPLRLGVSLWPGYDYGPHLADRGTDLAAAPADVRARALSALEVPAGTHP